MELDSRKKSRRDRMMSSNSFETQEVKEIGPKEAGESRGFPILCMEITEDVFQMEGKECNVQERLKMLYHGISNFVWASGNGGGKVGGSRKKFSGREIRAKGLVRLFRARGSAELREVASGSATQGLGLRNGKVASQVRGVDQSRFPGRRTVGEIRRVERRGRRASNKAKKRVYRFRVKFG